MKFVNKTNIKVFTIIAGIFIGVTFIFSFIYAFNPITALFGLPKGLITSMDSKPVLASDIVGIHAWINADDGNELSLRDLQGKVVLIDFWTYTCINCQRSLPYVTAWDEKYRDSGLVVIGVHTPEFQFEKKLENVQEAVRTYNIKYPVALDNDYKTWKAYNNLYWPAKYLIDKNGMIVYKRFGEGAYEQTEAKIQELLAQ